MQAPIQCSWIVSFGFRGIAVRGEGFTSTHTHKHTRTDFLPRNSYVLAFLDAEGEYFGGWDRYYVYLERFDISVDTHRTALRKLPLQLQTLPMWSGSGDGAGIDSWFGDFEAWVEQAGVTKETERDYGVLLERWRKEGPRAKLFEATDLAFQGSRLVSSRLRYADPAGNSTIASDQPSPPTLDPRRGARNLCCSRACEQRGARNSTLQIS